jgi:hypothetical protein
MENFRGLAIFFVMLSHISTFRLYGEAGKFISFVVGDATTWFVFISGYLFYHVEHKKFSYGSYLLKKVKFVLLPYSIISVPAILTGIVFSRHYLLGLTPVAYAGWSLAVGGAVFGPMWFIPMITIFFMFSAIFNKLGRTQLQVWVVGITILFSLFSRRPVGNLNPFLQFLHFLGFYLLGVMIASNGDAVARLRTAKGAKYVIFVLSIVFLVTAFWYSRAESETLGFFDGIGIFNKLQFGKLLLLTIVFYLFEQYLDHPNRLLGWLAEISFGLFFIHGIYMSVYQKLVQVYPPEHEFSMVAMELGLVLACSVFTVTLLKFVLRGKSRYVIGC